MKVLYFSTRTCAPCAQFKPIAMSVCSELGIQLNIIDAIEQTNLANRYGVSSVPTLVILDNNSTVVHKQTGAMPKAQLHSMLNQYNQN